jgi:hypothetical protein
VTVHVVPPHQKSVYEMSHPNVSVRAGFTCAKAIRPFYKL